MADGGQIGHGPVPPWATDRGWNAVARCTGAGLLFAAPAQPMMRCKPKPSMEANPWEGVMGPGLAESEATVKTYARSDVSTLIKTPKEVWKAGKPPTQFTTAPLPGTNAEKQAAKRTPAHLRGNANASRGVVASFERMPDVVSIKSTKMIWKTEDQCFADGTTIPDVTSLTIRPRGRPIPTTSMSMASLHELGAQSSEDLPERAQSASGALEGTEFVRSSRRPDTEAELEALVRGLKVQHAKLQQTSRDKEAELERLHSARDRSDRDEAQVGEADKDFEEFQQRIEARNNGIDDRLPDLISQKRDLQDVTRRLEKANKVMNNRLGTCREELRVYNGEIRDMQVLLKEVETSRNEAQTQVEKLKVSAKEDAKKRNQDLARRQARVEKMLAETKEQAERLKEAQNREEEEKKARQAQEDLARQRAFENGTNFGQELRRIRELVGGPEAAEDPVEPQEDEGKLATAMKKIFQAAHTSDGHVEEVLVFWKKSQDRRLTLENLAKDLTVRVERLSAQAANPSAQAAPAEGRASGSAETQDLENAVRDIETFADQSMAVNEAMRKLLEKYIKWMAKMYKPMVHVCSNSQGKNEDETKFLRKTLELAKSMPNSETDEKKLAKWCSDSLVIFENALEVRIKEVERVKRQRSSADAGAPRGPGMGPRITAISSNQTMLVSQRAGMNSKGATQMERL